MSVITADFHTIDGTEAAEGVSGGRSVIADRPDGVAGGQGLGFNGGQLLALAVGGCLCNDLRYVAHRRDAALGAFSLHVEVDVDDSGVVTDVRVQVDGGESRDAVAALLEEAAADSTIVNAVKRGAPVTVERR
jgi:organic hydroperoxide reductase OsmC/OhrA